MRYVGRPAGGTIDCPRSPARGYDIEPHSVLLCVRACTTVCVHMHVFVCVCICWTTWHLRGCLSSEYHHDDRPCLVHAIVSAEVRDPLDVSFGSVSSLWIWSNLFDTTVNELAVFVSISMFLFHSGCFIKGRHNFGRSLNLYIVILVLYTKWIMRWVDPRSTFKNV